MALVLRRVTHPWECVRCSITKKIISYGEEYYYDTEDGTIIDFNYYYDKKFQQRVEEAMPKVDMKMSQLDYQVNMLEKERQFLEKTMLDRKQYNVDARDWQYHDNLMIECEEDAKRKREEKDNDGR